MARRSSTEIEDTVVTGGYPGSISNHSPAIPGTPVKVAATATQEYVAGSGYSWYSSVSRALPWYLDDVGRDFGADIYQRMLLDSQVRSVVNVLKAGILENGIQLTSAVDDKTADGYEQASKLTTAVEKMLDNLGVPLDDVLWDMLDAIAVGNRVAEQVYELDAGGLTLSHLSVKPFDAYAFVIDVYFKTVGILGRVPGQPFGVQQGTLLADLEHTVNLLPRSKFAVLAFRPHNGDPRGTSVCRPAFDPWNQKQQLKREYLKYLTQFATPSLIGYTAPEAQQYQMTDSTGALLFDTYGNPVMQTPEQDMLAALEKFANGVATVFPYGANVEPIQMSGDGAAYLNAFDFFNREITKAVLHQTLATEEGEHQARAAASTHKDILDTIIRQAKRSVERMLTRDVLRTWMSINGQANLIDLLPTVSLGSAETEDLPTLWTAAAALHQADYLHSSQYAELDRQLALPERNPPDASTLPVKESINVNEAVTLPGAPSTSPGATDDTSGKGTAGFAADKEPTLKEIFADLEKELAA